MAGQSKKYDIIAYREYVTRDGTTGKYRLNLGAMFEYEPGKFHINIWAVPPPTPDDKGGSANYRFMAFEHDPNYKSEGQQERRGGGQQQRGGRNNYQPKQAKQEPEGEDDIPF